MPEYLAPGVYIEEISTGPKPIEGVSTSTAGFVGLTERGPEPPRLITSWLDFQRWYGGYREDSYLAYAIQGFFDNGGQRCYVTRIVGDTATVARGGLGNLQLYANGRGAWGNNIAVEVFDASNSPAGANWFRLEVSYWTAAPADPSATDAPDPDVFEQFDNLTHENGAANSVVTVINASSRLLRARWDPADATPTRPASGNPISFLPNSANPQNGQDVAILPNDFLGQEDYILTGDEQEMLGQGRGLMALALVDDISLLIAPDEVRSGLEPITGFVLNQCEALKDRFAILAAGRGASDPDPGGSPRRPPRDTSYGAFYLPWIWVYDPANNRETLVPATGHIAGIYARTDIERGVHKAPANEVVRGARDLEYAIPKGLQDVYNPRGINCLRDFRADGRGLRVWGARTMSSDGEWKYVNVRRLFLFIEESIDEATQWVVFEPNTEATWARVRRSITNFLIRVWRNGALMGTTEEEAFFVKCDRTTMTQDDIDNGRLICYIGVAPAKPAEFVIFRFSQKTAEA